MNIEKIKIYAKHSRTIILVLLLLAFFLPWISYGYISKSAFTIPFSPQDIQNILNFASLFEPEIAKKVQLPKELVYLYALYIYPVLVALLFFVRSRVVSIIVALIPLLPFIIAYQILPIDIINYMGVGFILTLIASVALIIESLFRKEVV